MNFLEVLMHPITQEIFGGIKYTAQRVIPLVQEQMMAKPVSEADIKQAAADTAAPNFDEVIDEGEQNENRTGTPEQAPQQPG